MSPCPACGGLQTRVTTTASWWMLMLADLFGQEVRACARCGWLGRMRPSGARKARPSRRHRRSRSQSMERPSAPAAHADVNFDEIDRALRKDR